MTRVSRDRRNSNYDVIRSYPRPLLPLTWSTYASVCRVLLTLSASAMALAPSSPTLLLRKLFSMQDKGQQGTPQLQPRHSFSALSSPALGKPRAQCFKHRHFGLRPLERTTKIANISLPPNSPLRTQFPCRHFSFVQALLRLNCSSFSIKSSFWARCSLAIRPFR